MNKNEQFFNDWLHKNINRFSHHPIRKNRQEFYFRGVTRQVYLIMTNDYTDASLAVDDKDGNNFDFLYIQYIGDLKYAPNKGYFDADRVDEIYSYYPTVKELLVAEVFEPIIIFCNKNFIEKNCLYLYGNVDKNTSATISSKNVESRMHYHTKITLLKQT